MLFQGDSITDAGRDRQNDGSLGAGYANFVAAWLQAAYPERNLIFLNRGIGGNRVCDLEERWTEDCIALRPDWVSILVGVNDTWRRFDSGLPSQIEDFEACCRRICARVRAEARAKIIIMEPFLLPHPPDRVLWREDLLLRIDAVRAVARDYSAIYIPLDGIFAAACCRQEPVFWAEDGVHPTQAGHALIAQAWIRAVGGRSSW